jgi:hypothetical protein
MTSDGFRFASAYSGARRAQPHPRPRHCCCLFSINKIIKKKVILHGIMARYTTLASLGITRNKEDTFFGPAWDMPEPLREYFQGYHKFCAVRVYDPIINNYKMHLCIIPWSGGPYRVLETTKHLIPEPVDRLILEERLGSVASANTLSQ